jgi:hypothetical protein
MIFSGEKIITKEIVLKSLSLINTQEDKTNGISFPDSKKIETLKDFEKIVRAKYFAYVRSHSISDSEAAQKLGLAPPNFYRMCRELGIK